MKTLLKKSRSKESLESRDAKVKNVADLKKNQRAKVPRADHIISNKRMISEADEE